MRILLAAGLVLAGCATRAPPPALVKAPVAVSCVPDALPPAPAYPDSAAALAAAPSMAGRYRLLAAGWPLRDARLTALEAIVANCR